MARYRFPGRRLLSGLLTAVFVLPTVVMGAAMLALLPAPVERGVWAILAAHVAFNLAVVVRTVGAVWEHLPGDLEAAAATLGASPWRVAREITLPLLRPAILAAASIVFVFTFTSFGVIRVVGNAGTSTIEVEIWRRATQLGDLGAAATLAVGQLVVVAGVVGWSAWQQRRHSRALALRPLARRRPPRPGAERRLVAITAVATAVVVVAPLAALVERSLRVRSGYSLTAWRHLGRTEIRPGISVGVDPRDALLTSLRIAAVATVLAVALGALAALAIVAWRRGGRLLDTGLMLPIATSAVTIGFGILITFDEAPLDWRASWWIVPIGHALVAVPFVVRATLPGAARDRPAAARGGRHARGVAAAGVAGDHRAPPPTTARGRRGPGGGDLARRVRGDELPHPQRLGDDADRDRASARPHRRRAAGPGLRAGDDPRRRDDRDRAPPRPRRPPSAEARTRPCSKFVTSRSRSTARPSSATLHCRSATREVVALLGPSGSGKSTLLRVIAGLVVPASGSVHLDGRDITRLPTHRRGIGMVFQDEQLFPHRDVAANIGFGLKMQGVPVPDRERRVEAMLELVGLRGFGRRHVTDLSGGEAKRVALARSLAPAPRALLLDEPLTGLDRELHDRLAGELGRILRQAATTTLLVTHDRDEATTLADRVVTMNELRGPGFSIVELTPAETHPLRAAVLRNDTPSRELALDGDDEPATLHLGVRDRDGRLVAVSTWLRRSPPGRDDAPECSCGRWPPRPRCGGTAPATFSSTPGSPGPAPRRRTQWCGPERGTPPSGSTSGTGSRSSNRASSTRPRPCRTT